MYRLISFLLLASFVIGIALPLWAAEEPSFLLYGIVTVRDGNTMLCRNPELTDDQVTQCTEMLEGWIDLDRKFSTSTNDDGALAYTWGEDEGMLSQKGLVPCVAYFVTPGQYVALEECEAAPLADEMGISWSVTIGVVQVFWWVPETTESLSLSIKYYDSSSYKRVAFLKGEEIAVDAGGTSPDGVNWNIASIGQEDERLVINVESDRGPDGHRFDFWISTSQSDEPLHEAPWTNESEDGSKLIYPVSPWLTDDEQMTTFEIRERHPDRAKTWAVKDFALKAE
ncbi:MAG: hypothetical protein JW889_13975 [Verrucomicrobia bacterium]|nr:hypothetical protein [Verrucomicrobiota bacterium]